VTDQNIKLKEEKHQDELQDVQNFDDQETHQNNVCLEGLRRRWKRIRKVSAFLGVNQKQWEESKIIPIIIAKNKT
jgi:hypothetical protein